MRRLAAVLMLVATPALADKPHVARDATAWCNGGGDTFVENADGTWTPREWTDPDPPRYTVVWRGFLDRDKRKDVILNEGDCGTQECMHAAYVQCPDKTYKRVMGPDYASRVRVRGKARGWAIIQLEHVGDLENGRRGRAWSPVKFGVEGYTEQ